MFLLLAEELRACLPHLVQPLLGRAHLLDDLLQLTCMCQLALDKFSFETLLNLGGQIKLVVHTFMFV